MKKFQAYINGKFVDSPKQVNIISPLNLKVYGQVPSLNPEQIENAFKVAKNAFLKWQLIEQKTRNQLINTFTNLLYKKRNELAEIMHYEIGKSVEESIVEIERTIDYINKTIKAWDQLLVKKIVIKNKISYQKRLPLGVVLAIAPFNYPVNLSLAKIIPALISGNTIVFKAASNGSLTGGFLANLFAKSNFPAGVFNYVSGAGRDIGDSLIANPNYNMITFTGGVQVGKKIAANCKMRPMILELGGNDAAYVRNDANLELALKEVFDGAFGFAGQRCTAIKRLILHHDIAQDFISKLVIKAKNHLVEPLIDQKAANYVASLLEEKSKTINKVLLAPIFKDNHVSIGIVHTLPTSKIWNEEQFGPVLPIVIAKNDQEAISLINQSTFGLQNSLFTQDLDWALKIAPAIESGTVNINGKSSRGPDEFPFSGIKDSGWGVQGIYDALISMTRIHNIVVNK